MSTCAKRAVIQMGDRPNRVARAALAVQSNARQMAPRVLPPMGGYGMPLGGLTKIQPYVGRPLNHGTLQTFDPATRQHIDVSNLAREVADAFRPPQGPVGHSGGRAPAGGVGNGWGTGGSIGGGTDTGGGPSSGSPFTEARVIRGLFRAPYTEPMFIPLPPNFLCEAVIAARIVDPNDPIRYFRSGVACDFIPYGARLLVRSIDGMTVAPQPDPAVLTYTFIYYGV